MQSHHWNTFVTSLGLPLPTLRAEWSLLIILSCLFVLSHVLRHILMLSLMAAVVMIIARSIKRVISDDTLVSVIYST